jgi:hypothetical protein
LDAIRFEIAHERSDHLPSVVPGDGRFRALSGKPDKLAPSDLKQEAVTVLSGSLHCGPSEIAPANIRGIVYSGRREDPLNIAVVVDLASEKEAIEETSDGSEQKTHSDEDKNQRLHVRKGGVPRLTGPFERKGCAVIGRCLWVKKKTE